MPSAYLVAREAARSSSSDDLLASERQERCQESHQDRCRPRSRLRFLPFSAPPILRNPQLVPKWEHTCKRLEHIKYHNPGQYFASEFSDRRAVNAKSLEPKRY